MNETILRQYELISGPEGAEISDLFAKLVDHELYRSVRTLEEACRFMEMQVWCVWDFMTLAKSVQIGVGCYSIPWVPPLNTALVAAANGIIREEEADRGPDGAAKSHLELFIDSMRQAGARTNAMESFIAALRAGEDAAAAILNPEVPVAAREFVNVTLAIAAAPLHTRVACFCLTREELVPRMFLKFIPNLPDPEDRLDGFIWYLKRHVELDAATHAPLARQLVDGVIGADVQKRLDARIAVRRALQARLDFLDSTLLYIRRDSTASQSSPHAVI